MINFEPIPPSHSNSDSIYYARVSTNNYSSWNILKDDILCIDRSIIPTKGMKGLCVYNKQFCIREIDEKTELWSFEKVIKLNAIQLWGVIKEVIRKTQKKAGQTP